MRYKIVRGINGPAFDAVLDCRGPTEGRHATVPARPEGQVKAKVTDLDMPADVWGRREKVQNLTVGDSTTFLASSRAIEVANEASKG